MSESDWCLIESDPGVFTELIRGFGCKGVEVEEIWSLEDSIELKPLHGLIFLFMCEKEQQPTDTDESIVLDSRLEEEIYFANQVVNNACATLAIVNLLLNVQHQDVELGDALQNLKSFSASFDSKTKGLALANSPLIRQVHNSFSRQTMLEFDNSLAGERDEASHFIAYVPINGRLYELDGLKRGPIDHGRLPDGLPTEEWVQHAIPVIRKRMQRYASSELRFTLLAVISDRKTALQKQLDTMTAALDEGGDESGGLTEAAAAEISRLTEAISHEEEKIARYKRENARRRHNYIPMVVELLKILGERGQLNGLVDAAIDKSRNRQAWKAEGDRSATKDAQAAKTAASAAGTGEKGADAKPSN
ncbi:hypothetical protein BOX15_Mlig012936g2 [Macrostomum lignano]|uniref:Ubiquitin carboxyl-terminal hydrolase n=1 Tax=Macrostomum lignano TaxID=282301 RepID=A0A267FVD0_9PLAT|nr:hypothetical protein BOX15_Mlig012936g2 [Macrostomum lignano]